MGAEDEPFLDDDAGRLVRPYTVSNGRTRPSIQMELLSWVMATGRRPRGYLALDHARALRLCGGPITVAEVAAHLKLPAAITKVVLSDLVDCGAVSTRAPSPVADPTDPSVLEAVLHGLQRRL
ncbi:DUF742 domain-containing protein [Micromonospora mangrovi]|uniref:DUF742 domain-containing protein n=2 Tax=Micromonospora TaxID=1873 RepID=A0AAU8HJG3_9ACTN